MAVTVRRLDRVVIVAGDLDRLTGFYAGLGLEPGEARAAPDHAALAEARHATARTLTIGAQTMELVAFDPPGAAYPLPGRASDRWFQHVALVAPDIAAAMARLRALDGWMPISRDGAVELPRAAGRVSAYKFRDPEGHPLEVLAFPADAVPARWQAAGGVLLGYDHSAIGVADISTSIAFWRGEMGLALGPRTLNEGPGQAALDGIDAPVVDVVAMQPAETTPHIELLGYHVGHRRPSPGVGPRDGAATRLVLAADGVGAPRLMRDPDGHWLQLLPG